MKMGRKELFSYALQNKGKVWVEWSTAWVGLNDEGVKVPVPIVVRTLVQDCINMARVSATSGADEDILEEFIRFHKAILLPVTFIRSHHLARPKDGR